MAQTWQWIWQHLVLRGMSAVWLSDRVCVGFVTILTPEALSLSNAWALTFNDNGHIHRILQYAHKIHQKIPVWAWGERAVRVCHSSLASMWKLSQVVEFLPNTHKALGWWWEDAIFPKPHELWSPWGKVLIQIQVLFLFSCSICFPLSFESIAWGSAAMERVERKDDAPEMA